MSKRRPIHSTTFPQRVGGGAGASIAPGESDGAAELSGARALALLALVGIAVALLLAPVAVASVSMLDGDLFDRLRSGFAWIVAPVHYLDLLRIGSSLAVAGFVATVRENP
jgi:hypothetical protein